MHNAYIVLYDTNGNKTAILTSWRSLLVEHKVNNFSTHTISLNLSDPAVQYFTLDTIVELYVSTDGIWRLEYAGFHRTPRREVTENNRRIFTSYGRGFLDLVHRRNILYKGTTQYTLKSGPAETVIKSFVSQNCASAATSPPRLRDGVFPGFTVEADAARGGDWFGQRSLDNVLETIQTIADHGEVDFDVVRTTGANFEFRVYYPYRGTDKTSTVVFSLEHTNIIAPSVTFSRTEEANVAIVAGPGQGTARRTLIRTASTMNDSPWNDIETVVEASGEERLEDLQHAGDEALKRSTQNDQLSFTVKQTESSRYGIEYVLGDLVMFQFQDYSVAKQIHTASINIAEGRLDVSIGFKDTVLS